jgi:hypothetical protein
MFQVNFVSLEELRDRRVAVEVVRTEHEDDGPALWGRLVVTADLSLAQLPIVCRLLVVGDVEAADDPEEVLCWRVATPPSTFAT